MSIVLDKKQKRHGLLQYTGYCYGCGSDIRYLSGSEPRYYCSRECMQRRPPKMVIAEAYWGKSFVDLALEHLNAGGSINALADLCGVHRQAIYAWLETVGIKRRIVWESVH